MQKLARGISAVAAVAACVGLALWFANAPDREVLGDGCLSLSATVAQAPTVSIGRFEYDAPADGPNPPLPPEAALQAFTVADGFRIELVAHEPMISTPVAMDIDPDGRLWVVEMTSYMPVHDLGDWETAVREQVPKGRIVVLEDTTGDGKVDSHRVFRDGLILPRAIKVLRDGVLVGEPPNVWFIRDTTGDGRGDSRELVSTSYGDPNLLNVEGMPNGLMWGLDNWIHSARQAGESLRRVNGEWLTRPFEPLGQWGITQDDWGRLYSSNNSWPLEVNLVPHGYSERHPLFSVRTGIAARIAPNTPLWPGHPAGVNRGYQVGKVVRTDGTLLQNTSAASTVIYRGDQFGSEFVGNAFTPEPAANIIQRIIVTGDPAEIEARGTFAYAQQEFLASTDERFRPVNIYNAPDGSLYVIDMYRGLIQHARYLTDYLRSYAIERGLHEPTPGLGRIYRIVREDRPIVYRTPRFSTMRARDVVRYLQSENGHLRDQAQQVLAQCSPLDTVSSLEALTTDVAAKAYTRLQALWTLEGFDRTIYGLDRLVALALRALDDEHPRVRAAAVRLLEPAIESDQGEVMARLARLAAEETAPAVRLQLVASLGEGASQRALELIAAVLDAEAGSVYFQEMALTTVYRREAHLADILRLRYQWPESGNTHHESVLSSLADATRARVGPNLEHLTKAERELYEMGREQYASCAACHGVDGRGGSGIGPPLAGSAWVGGDVPRIVRILLHGFEGGAAERRENIAGVMPGHAFLSDESVAAVLTFVRQSWGNHARPVAPEEVRKIRAETGDRRTTWSPSELRRVN
jgi:mono/diheme cytochrome c family protein/glucose/arabinose dehydrogenase